MPEARPSARQKLRRVAAQSAGSAAIEFALVAPLFLLLLLGIFVYGMFFTVSQNVQQIAAEAARAAIGGMSDGERENLAIDRARRDVERFALLKSDRMSVDAGMSPNDANIFEVVVRYDARYLGLTIFSSLLPTPPERIERVAVIRRGGY